MSKDAESITMLLVGVLKMNIKPSLKKTVITSGC